MSPLIPCIKLLLPNSAQRGDGRQPDKGNETIYLVWDALTGRVLTAEQVKSSETAVMKALLAPVVALGAPVLGTITDAQESELQAVEQLWPEVPHQVSNRTTAWRRGSACPHTRASRSPNGHLAVDAAHYFQGQFSHATRHRGESNRLP